jgi:DNA-binding LytR/AlgR family response regulator
METYVQKTPGLNVAGKCANALEAFSLLSKQQVDAVLLDINMPEISGMDLLRTLKNPPPVIFTTAYAEFALESYELNAIDYLVKPIPFDRFLKAIDKLKAFHKKLAPTEQQAQLRPADDFIFVKSDGKLVRIELTKLLFIEGLKDYIKIHTTTSKVLVHSTMKNMEDQLSAYSQFIRIHKSHIININHITEIDGNAIRIGNESLTIGATYRDTVMSVLDSYKLQ